MKKVIISAPFSLIPKSFFYPSSAILFQLKLRNAAYTTVDFHCGISTLEMVFTKPAIDLYFE
jgi:hypothetical protein